MPDPTMPEAPTPMPALPAEGTKDQRVTPMMAQYIEIKHANPDSLLFYRMGDFYELFFHDAEAASQALGIALTKRGKHLGVDIPMCGVPVHAADDYLQRLINLGFRVAVCEQTEDPAEARKRGAKSVVQRNVVRLVTPGTLTEDSLLDAGRPNYLLAISQLKSGQDGHLFGCAWADISTGQFHVCEVSGSDLPAMIARIDPSEIILPLPLHNDEQWRMFWDEQRGAVMPLDKSLFDSTTANARLTDYYRVKTLDGYGQFSRSELAAASAILAYVAKTQLDERPPLNPPSRQAAGATLQIDAATRANLELLRTLGGEKRGSLLSSIDRTLTSSGARLLAERLAAPLTAPDAINHRLDDVSALVEDNVLRDTLRDHLKAVPDIARALSRLSLNRGGPRDLGALRTGLQAAQDLRALLLDKGDLLPEGLQGLARDLGQADPAFAAHLGAALNDDLPVFKRDGGFVRAGYRPDLDQARALRDESRQVIASLQAQYAEQASVKALKIKHNNVLGYFIDVSANHGDKLMAAPLNETFIHRQTLANSVRFTTTELSDLQAQISSAGERAQAIETDVFNALLVEMAEQNSAIKQLAGALAALDVTCGLAVLASERAYARPVVDESLAFNVDGGRHPVVEDALRQANGEPFVANGCDLSSPDGQSGQIWLITGPNMAGKSTFLRQNALIAILAQMGSFVPATSAHIGVVDRLFSRVGAADDLARGRSTFMVEMVETAGILNQAGPRALVILDEIGRGTATFDGLSIAWAAIENLHEVNRCRALFATHYHELTALSGSLDRLSNATVRVTEWEGDVVFLHEIVPGAADRSYGIQVAKLAGLPDLVVKRAEQVLAQLEEQDAKGPATLIDDLPLFAILKEEPAPPAAANEPDHLRDYLGDLSPDDLSPREALDALYELKRLSTS